MNDIILKISNMKIYFVCYTFDENIDNLNSEQQKEIEFYKNLIHFLNLSDIFLIILLITAIKILLRSFSFSYFIWAKK